MQSLHFLLPLLLAGPGLSGTGQVLTEQLVLEPQHLDFVTTLSLEGPWLAAGGASTEGFEAGVLYQRQGTAWVDQAFYGAWVDVDQDVFLGSVSEDHYSFVYRRSQGAWAFEGLLPDDYARVHGDRLLTNSFRSTGPHELHVWKRGPVEWAREAVIAPDSPQTGTTCCYPFEIWGNTVAFRARGASGATAIFVYVRERGVWRKQAELVPSDSLGTGASYVLGLELAGRSLVALYQASAGSGWAAYVWEREGDTWHERARLAPADGDLQSVDLQEDRLVLGSGPAHGTAHVYERSQGRWIEHAQLVASDGFPIGRAVALDGRTVVAATHFGSPARIYQFRVPAFSRITTFGCQVNPAGSLVVLSGVPAIGTSLRLGLDNPLGTQAPGTRAFLAAASRPDVKHPCGTLVPFRGLGGGPGERLLRRERILGVMKAGTWTGAGQPVTVDLPIPPDPALVGHSFYLQGALLDSSAAATVRFGFTEGIELEIGVPELP